MRWGSKSASLGMVVDMTDKAVLVLWEDGSLQLMRTPALRELSDDEAEDSVRRRAKT